MKRFLIVLMMVMFGVSAFAYDRVEKRNGAGQLNEVFYTFKNVKEYNKMKDQAFEDAKAICEDQGTFYAAYQYSREDLKSRNLKDTNYIFYIFDSGAFPEITVVEGDAVTVYVYYMNDEDLELCQMLDDMLVRVE